MNCLTNDSVGIGRTVDSKAILDTWF